MTDPSTPQDRAAAAIEAAMATPEQQAFRRSLRGTPCDLPLNFSPAPERIKVTYCTEFCGDSCTCRLRFQCPHEPSEACGGIHCWSHGVDEPGEGAWRVCFECGHAYRSPAELQRAWTQSAPPGLPDRDTPPPAGQICFCPLCMHDWLPAAAGEDTAVRLLRKALDLREYGERGAGDAPTWLEWEREAEAFLASLPGAPDKGESAA